MSSPPPKQKLTASGGGDGANANLEVFLVDPDSNDDPQWSRLREQHKSRPLPWAVLQLPPPLDQDENPAKIVWTGPLAELAANQLANSPKRREIADKLLAGDSAVWLLLQSGNKKLDVAALDMLQKESAAFATNAPPPLEGADETALAGFGFSDSVPLRVSFAVVTIAPDDPHEKWFLRVFRGLYPELPEPSKGPVAIPIFGRGRALGAATSEQITPAVIRKGCEFLTGECTCEIKGDNPGRDLLMTVNWTRRLHTATGGAPLPPLVGAISAAPPATSPAAVEYRFHAIPLSSGLWLALASIVAVVAIATVIILIRSAKAPRP